MEHDERLEISQAIKSLKSSIAGEKGMRILIPSQSNPTDDFICELLDKRDDKQRELFPRPDGQNNSSPGETLRPYANVPTELLKNDIAHFFSEIGHAARKLRAMMNELEGRGGK